MTIQQHILSFVLKSNWILLILASAIGLAVASKPFTLGIVCGGLIVTCNFHLLAKTLRKALQPPHMAKPASVLAKYYVRFTVSGIIIFILVYRNLVDPIGLLIGLSVVVASITLATLVEFRKLLFKEAV